MIFYKKQKPFISLVCVISLLLSMFNIPVAAADTNCVTATTSATVKQGNSAYCYVDIDSTESLASLEITVHYDSAKVKITDVYNSISCTLYDSAINTDNIQLSYIMDGEGTATKTRLFYFRYQVLDDADIGDAYFDITIGEAYDNSINDVAVSGLRCSFTIAEKTISKSCSVYGSNEMSTAIEQEFTIDYRLSTYQIASGTVVINYDSELFEVVSVTNGAFLTDKVVDINTDFTGELYISFVGTDYYSDTNLISVTFRTIKNVEKTSEIVFKATELLDKDLNTYSCKEYTTSVSITYDEAYTGDSPAMRLDGTFSYENMQVTLVVSLEANSNLGAGDFVITFDPELVTYNSCTKEFAPSFFNINDKNIDSGVLKFHIISLSDIVTEETVLTVVFDVNRPYGSQTVDFTLDGTGLTDSLTESILLNFVDDTVWLEYQVIFQNWDGTELSRQTYRYGDTIVAPPDPIREADNTYAYTFVGWDKELVCSGDMIITAEYTEEIIEPDYEAIIGDTTYDTLQDALNAATEATIKLAKNVEADGIVLYKNNTLDLNGKTLSADYFVGFNGTKLVDNSSDKTGLLEVLPGNLILAEENKQMPVLTDAGYKFATVKMNAAKGKNASIVGSFTSDYIYLIMEPSLGSAFNELLKDGAANNEIQIGVRLSWTSDGTNHIQDCYFKDEYVEKSYASTSDLTVMNFRAEGLNGFTEMKANPFVVSDSGAECLGADFEVVTYSAN